MTPESVPALRITTADIRAIWFAIANLKYGEPTASAPEPPAERAPRVLDASLAA
jgi:hypothetical protein